MSRITYCSLEEAWGDNYIKNNKESPPDLPPELSSRENVNKQIFKNKYDLLNEKSNNDRDEVINNMNNIERNIQNNNINTEDYNKYRTNPKNIVKKNDYETSYTPYKESIEKKALQDKLLFLEKQMTYYKNFVNEDSKMERIEHFENSNITDKNKNNDMIDLIILIIIGLLIIFVMDFIFKMGKQIGAKKIS